MSRQLAVVEAEIREQAYEAFFYIGERLREIRDGRLYEQEEFGSWSDD